MSMRAYTQIQVFSDFSNNSIIKNTNMHIHALIYDAKCSVQLFKMQYSQMIADCAQYRYTIYLANVH